MALFKKRPPCPFCGGKVKGLLTFNVAGHPVCDACYGDVHLPKGAGDDMTLEEFQTYRMFREENDLLRRQFQETKRVGENVFSKPFIFDVPNRLFAMERRLDGKIVFEGKHIKSFSICEDEAPLFEGSADGLVCYASNVPDYINERAEWIGRWARRETNTCVNVHGEEYESEIAPVPEPYRHFVIEIQLDHPYWNTLEMNVKGTRLKDLYPLTPERYLEFYHTDAGRMEDLARTLMELAFPGAPERKDHQPKPGLPPKAAPPDPDTDVMEEIQKAKALLEQGLLTQEEFAAKKRQLLGI